jgi:hypothetical protein
VATAVFSSASYFVSLVHPDIFLAFAFIVFFIAITTKSTIKKLLLLMVVALLISTHLSFILSTALFLVVYFVCTTNKKQNLVVLCIIPIAIGFLYTPKIFSTNTNTLSESYKFYVAGVIKYNILEQHLEAQCDTKKYIICDGWPNNYYKNANGFLWGVNKRTVTKLHNDAQKRYSVEQKKADYRRLLINVLLYEPLDVLAMVTKESLHSFTLKDPFHFLFEINYQAEKSYAIQQITSMKLNDIEAFRTSMTYANVLHFMKIAYVTAKIQVTMTLIFLGMQLHVFLWRHSSKQNKKYFIFCVLLTCFILCNAIVSVLFSDSFVRYFARINWLFTLSIFIFIAIQLQEKLSTYKKRTL